MAIKDKLRELRAESKVSQEKLASALGVDRSAVAQWESGWTTPKMGNIELIAKYFGIPKSKLIDDTSDGYTEWPLYGAIAAGTPIDMQEIESTFPIPVKLTAKYPDSFFLRVQGDSMNRRIPNGSIVLIDPSETEPNEKAAYAVCVNGYSATVKRAKRLANGFELLPDSHDPTYQPMIYDYNDDSTETVTIIGKVVWMTAPFDYEI